MKRVIVVALLLLSFASVALADGGGGPVICPQGGSQCQPIGGVVLLADGSGGPPVNGTPTKPPQWSLAA
jgi:hypothetical protein